LKSSKIEKSSNEEKSNKGHLEKYVFRAGLPAKLIAATGVDAA
jgi:hypothetical protein